MDLKSTLLMPQTAFEMRGNLAQKEPLIQQRWEAMKLYDKQLEARYGNPPFVLHDGPPYANGDIHIGHSLNKTLKDFVVRYHSLKGNYTPFVPGWDTHGLPIETALAKKGVNRKEMSVAEFRAACETYARSQVDRQMIQMKRLGTLADYDHPYVTLDKEFEAVQLGIFADMALKGLIYKGKKPVYWSPSSETALAEAEIEYEDAQSHSIYVAFKVVKPTLKSRLSGDESVIIWTTTPWTLPANLAISVHPDFDYGVYETERGVFVFATKLADHVTQALGLTQVTLRQIIKGSELEFVETQHPLYPRTSIIICGDHVTDDAGTGCVHTAPGHGHEDYQVGLKYNLPILCPVDGKGLMTEEAGERLVGKPIEVANKVVLEWLKENNALLHDHTFTHSYPHDWRTKKPVIIRATDQWFASISPIKDRLLATIKGVHWVNSWGEVRLANMMSDRADWCISRQRAWGVPIPIIYNEDNTPILDRQVFDHIIALVKAQGTNVWFEKSAQELLPPGYRNAASPNHQYRKETDIMDVWFDSGSTHTAVLKARGLPFPADLYLEGSDQYRGWFNSSLIVSVAVHNQAPYKTVASHGFILDGNGNKMSKSLGNTIDPNAVIAQYGADVLRLWIALADYQSDVRISMDLIKQVSEVYRKIRNTFRFLLGNLTKGEGTTFDPRNDQQTTFEWIDQAVLAKLEEVVHLAQEGYETYNFASAMQAIINFLTVDMSSVYLDLTKDILYCEAATSTRRLQVQTVLYRVIHQLLPLIAPVLPHTAEEIYDFLSTKDKESVHLTTLPDPVGPLQGEVLAVYRRVLDLRSDVLKALETARSAKLIGSAQEAQIELFIKDSDLAQLVTSWDATELNRFFIVSSVKLVSQPVGQSYSVADVAVQVHEGTKCDRCWNRFEHIHAVEDVHVCSRCAAAVGLHV